MITEVLLCRHCGGPRLVRNGHAPNGKQRYRCRDCGRAGRPDPGSAAHPEAFRRQVLAAYQERCSNHSSMRGVSRVFGVSRNTLADWVKKSQVAAAPLPDAGPGPG